MGERGYFLILWCREEAIYIGQIVKKASGKTQIKFEIVAFSTGISIFFRIYLYRTEIFCMGLVSIRAKTIKNYMNNNYKTEGTLAIYARQSREKETNGSIDEQLNKGRKTAATLGMSYVEYVDKGISAVSDTLSNRPECLRMMDDIENNRITAVFVYDMSRLTRSQVTNVAFKSIFKEKPVSIGINIDKKQPIFYFNKKRSAECQ